MVNTGDREAAVEVIGAGAGGVLFASPAGVELTGTALRVPPHAGALVDLG